MKHILLLLSGFLIGQGGMFLAQTYIISLQEFEIVAVLGIGLGLLSLLQWISDGGGVFLLSRQFSEPDFFEIFSSFIIARIIIGLSLYFLLSYTVYLLELDQQITSILNTGWIVVVIWSLNITGILDYTKKNELAGPVSGLCWLFSAIASVLLYESDFFGLYVGLFYITGLFVTVMVQWYVAGKSELLNDIEMPKIEIIITQIKLIISYNSAYISAQGYARIIPILIDKVFDTKLSGIYIYAKNISNMISQLIFFSRRVEFHELVTYVISEQFSFVGVLLRQKYSLFLSVFSAFISYLMLILIHYFDYNDYFDIVVCIAYMVSLVFGWVLVSAFGQVLLAAKRIREYSIILILSIVFGLIFLSLFLTNYGLLAVYGAELLMYFIQGISYIYLINRLRNDGVLGDGDVASSSF